MGGRLFTLRQLRRGLFGSLVLSVPLVAVAVLAEAGGSASFQRTLISFFITAMMVLAVQIFVGNSGILSFGHVAFAGAGAYAAALVTIPPALRLTVLPELPSILHNVELGMAGSVVLAAALAGGLALVLGGALTRMSELAMAVATLALLVVMHSMFVNWSSVTRGTTGIFGIPANATLWVALAGLLLLLVVARLYRESRPGLRLQATREDPVAARAVGVDVRRIRLGGWVLSAAAMGAAGALFAQSIIAFDPDQFYFGLTFTTLSMLVLGGRSSVSGVLVGAALVYVVEEALRPLERGFVLGSLDVPRLPGLVQVAVALLIIVVLVFRPSGLLGYAELEDVAIRIRARFGGRREGPPAMAQASERTAEAGQVAIAPAQVDTNGDALLVARDVRKNFSGVRALAGVDLSLRRGEILGLIGPNGSGKTTLLNVLAGELPLDEGSVTLDGGDVTSLPAHVIAKKGMVRTFQNIRLFPGMTVRENVLAAANREVTDADLDRLLARFGLGSVWDLPAGQLAYGIQRKVEIARAVIRRPMVLLLDEPAAGMNEAESETLLGMIGAVRDELGCSVVVIDHDLRLILRLCERIQVLNEGATIAVGPPGEVARDPRVIEAYLGREHEAGAEERRITGGE